MGDDNTAKSQLLTKAWFNLDKADAPDFKPINISLTPKPTTSTASTAPTNSTALTDSKPKDVFDADEGYDAALGRFMLNHNYFSRRRAIRKFNNQWADTEHYRRSIWENQRQNLLLQQQLNAARTAPVQPATPAPAPTSTLTPADTRVDAPAYRPSINWDDMAKKMGDNYTRDDVGAFLTWMNENKKGNLKIDRKFGTNTQAAWNQYGKEWEKSLTPKAKSTPVLNNVNTAISAPPIYKSEDYLEDEYDDDDLNSAIANNYWDWYIKQHPGADRGTTNFLENEDYKNYKANVWRNFEKWNPDNSYWALSAKIGPLVRYFKEDNYRKKLK